MSSSTPRDIGSKFEAEFVAMAISHGYSAKQIHGSKPHDAVVSGLRVQCKEKSFHEQGRVRIAKGQKRYRHGDWDVLALRFQDNLYLIPSHRLRMPGGTIKTVIRPRFFTRFIDAWSVFDGAERQHEERMLFDIYEEATDGF
jgi:hypothetical protein